MSSAMGLSGSESLPDCEKELGEPTSEGGGVGTVTLSTSMATRSLRDSEGRGDRKTRRGVSGRRCGPESEDIHSKQQQPSLELDLITPDQLNMEGLQ